MSRYEKMKNRYYEMKVHALELFLTYYHDRFQKLCRIFFFISIFSTFVKSEGIYGNWSFSTPGIWTKYLVLYQEYFKIPGIF